MRNPRPNPVSARLRIAALSIPAALAVAVTGVPAVSNATAEEPSAYIVEVTDVAGAVGAHQVLHATLRLRDGYRILGAYNNRIIQLSSLDDGVAFDSRVVRATVDDGALVFNVGLRPTKPGRHPINGVFRVGYIEGESEMSMVSLKLIANVTGE